MQSDVEVMWHIDEVIGDKSETARERERERERLGCIER